jgi:hypothetical protein
MFLARKANTSSTPGTMFLAICLVIHALCCSYPWPGCSCHRFGFVARMHIKHSTPIFALCVCFLTQKTGKWPWLYQDEVLFFKTVLVQTYLGKIHCLFGAWFAI